MAGVDPEVEAARLARWRPRGGRRVRTLAAAAQYVEGVGFALLFPARGVSLPSLYEAVGDRPLEHLGTDWNPDAELVWGWKDELPCRGLAWYGRFLRGRPSFLSPGLLTDVYPRGGEPHDFTEAPLGPDARRIAEMILLSGPTSTTVLRAEFDAYSGRGRARFDHALTELGRGLVVCTVGSEAEGGGWPAAVLELTARAFDLDAAGRRPAAERRLAAARAFLDAMVSVRPYELGNAFGWRAGPARQALEALVERGEARRSGPAYVGA